VENTAVNLAEDTVENSRGNSIGNTIRKPAENTNTDGGKLTIRK
jgi:hypothetical protein